MVPCCSCPIIELESWVHRRRQRSQSHHRAVMWGGKQSRMGTIWVVGWEQAGSRLCWAMDPTFPSHTQWAGSKWALVLGQRDPHRAADNAWCELLLSEHLMTQLISPVVHWWSYFHTILPGQSYFMVSTKQKYTSFFLILIYSISIVTLVMEPVIKFCRFSDVANMSLIYWICLAQTTYYFNHDNIWCDKYSSNWSTILVHLVV